MTVDCRKTARIFQPSSTPHQVIRQSHHLQVIFHFKFPHWPFSPSSNFRISGVGGVAQEDVLPGSHHSADPCLGQAFGASSKGLLDPPGTTIGHGGGGRLGAAGRLWTVRKMCFWRWKMTGWWFGTFCMFPYIGNCNPNWPVFFTGVGQPPSSFKFGWYWD